ncbi:MAG: hypothetical protein CBD16_08830 [Betaproteobacteria bacterium TMED156]|nr:MAG: hypothetical protein CBD16_08830 [Betaproteobacteria bacterium TMED156]
MNLRRKGLGRGLDVLLGQNQVDNKSGLKLLPINKIRPGSSQPRGEIEKQTIKGLAQAIKSQGVLQPILVRKIDGEYYEIIAGERRWRASQIAGLKEIPVNIKDVDDKAALEMALVENLQRKDLNPIEEAKGIDKLVKDFELTHAKVAESLGKSRVAVSNLLRLLNSEKEVQNMLLRGLIEQGHVRALLSLQKSRQILLAQQIIDSNLSVRQTEKKVKELLSNRNKLFVKEKNDIRNQDTKKLEQELSDFLNLEVSIKLKNPKQGVVSVAFSSNDEFEGFLKKISFVTEK